MNKQEIIFAKESKLVDNIEANKIYFDKDNDSYLTCNFFKNEENYFNGFFQLSMDYYDGIDFMNKIGFEQSTDSMNLNAPKTFYVSCGKVCFDLNYKDAQFLIDSKLVKIQISIIG